MDRVFLDTSGLIALEDADDRNHGSALRFQSQVREGVFALVTTNYVLDEVYTWIRGHLGHKRAVAFGNAIRSSRLVTVVWVSPALEGEAWDIFVQNEDKTYSFTDCTSFAVMRQLGLKQAFAFDRHFAQFGLEIVPGLR